MDVSVPLKLPGEDRAEVFSRKAQLSLGCLRAATSTLPCLLQAPSGSHRVSNGFVCHCGTMAVPHVPLRLPQAGFSASLRYPAPRFPGSSPALWLLAPQGCPAWLTPNTSQAGDPVPALEGIQCDPPGVLPSPAPHFGLLWGQQEGFSPVSARSCCLFLRSPCPAHGDEQQLVSVPDILHPAPSCFPP